MLAEILYTIYTNNDDESEKLISFFDGMNYYNSGISNCHAEWEEEGITVKATVSEDWNENKATKAVKRLMTQHHLDYDDVEAEFKL